jgi:hypothetical protein
MGPIPLEVEGWEIKRFDVHYRGAHQKKHDSIFQYTPLN